MSAIDDLMYPNDGSGFDEPQLTQEEQDERADAAKTKQSLPILDELIAELEEDIKGLDSISAMGIDASTPQVQVQIIMDGATKCAALLQTKLDKYKDWRDRYKA